MAFGFPPKYQTSISLNGQEPMQWLFLAISACQRLGWQIHQVNETGINAFNPSSWNGNGEILQFRIHQDSVEILSKSIGGLLVDYGKNKRRIHEFMESLSKCQEKYTAEELIIQAHHLAANIQQQPEEATLLDDQTSFSLVKLRPGYQVTPILILINVLLFIGMVASGANIFQPDNQHLINWGANFSPLTLEGQWWRLITNVFEHGGILHLAMNMYGLLFIGILLEPLIGRNRFILAYLLTGLAGSVASLWWHDITISVGASGAIFGLYGVFISLLTTNFVQKSIKQTFLTSTLVFTGFNLMNGLKPDSGIDNAAHIGGLISGLLIGYALYPSLKQSASKQLSAIAILLSALGIFGVTGWVLTHKSNDLPTADRMMADFGKNEVEAISFLQPEEKKTDAEMLQFIESSANPLWDKNERILDSMLALNIPDAYKENIKLMKKYVGLRKQQNVFFEKALSENSHAYEQQIDSCNQKISQVIELINGK